MTTATTPPPALSRSDGRAQSAYDLDFYAWTKEQAALLRASRLSETDLENIAEEIEALGRAERRGLASHVRTVVEHLMRLQASPATEPRAGWRETVCRVREDIEDMLEDSPSLRRELASLVARETGRARRLVIRQALAERGKPVDALSSTTWALSDRSAALSMTHIVTLHRCKWMIWH